MEENLNQTPQTAGPSVEELTQQLAEAKAESASKDSLIEELSAELEAKNQAPVTLAPVVKHSKKEYLVVIPVFQHEGVTYKASELSQHKDVVKELVEMGFGGLVEKV